MDKWSSIAVASGIAVVVAVHELEQHPGIEHSHAEQPNGPGEPIGRSVSAFAMATTTASSVLTKPPDGGNGTWTFIRPLDK